jgi:hypothetical protein
LDDLQPSASEPNPIRARVEYLSHALEPSSSLATKAIDGKVDDEIKGVAGPDASGIEEDVIMDEGESSSIGQ